MTANMNQATSILKPIAESKTPEQVKREEKAEKEEFMRMKKKEDLQRMEAELLQERERSAKLEQEMTK